MRRSGRVELYKMDTLRGVRAAGWDLHAHGRFAWLHRILWRALRRMGALAQQYDETVEVLRMPVSNDDIFAAILESYEGLFNVHRKPTEVLIGPATLSELLACPEVRDWNSPFQFTAQAGFDRTIYGLPIRVVPQMEGVVVLDERR